MLKTRTFHTSLKSWSLNIYQHNSAYFYVPRESVRVKNKFSQIPSKTPTPLYLYIY